MTTMEDTNKRLKATLDTVLHSKQILKRIRANSMVYFGQAEEIKNKGVAIGEPIGQQTIMREADIALLDKMMGRDPMLIVTGPDKDTALRLVNILLNDRRLTLTTSTTSRRAIRFRHSPTTSMTVTEDYVVGKDDTVDQMLGAETDRKNRGQVRTVVEIGTNHPLMKDRLQIAMLPPPVGDQDFLPDFVDGILQVVVYVHKNEKMDAKDQSYQDQLKQKVPSAQSILFNSSDSDAETFLTRVLGLVTEFDKRIRSQIQAAANSIAAAQMRLFNLINDENAPKEERVKRMIDDVSKQEEKKYEELKRKVNTEWKSDIVQQLRSKFDKDRVFIEVGHATMPERGSQGAEEYKDAVRDALAKIVHDAVKQAVVDTVNYIDNKLTDRMFEMKMDITDEYGMQHNFLPTDKADRESWKKNCAENISTLVENTLKAGQLRDGSVDEAWKKAMTEDLIRAVSLEALATMFTAGLTGLLDVEHLKFQMTKTIALTPVMMARPLTKPLFNKFLAKNKSEFGRDCYEIRALLTTLKTGHVRLTNKNSKGSRADVYKVEGADRMAKIFRADNPPRPVCIRSLNVRAGKEIPRIVEITDIGHTEDWQMAFIMKRYRCRLDEAFEEGLERFTLDQRLNALLDITKTVQALMDTSFNIKSIVSPRHFLVEDRSDKLVIDMSFVKFFPDTTHLKNDDSTAAQLGKLLTLMVAGNNKSGLTELSSKDDYMKVVEEEAITMSRFHHTVKKTVRKYFFATESLTLSMFARDTSTLIEMNKNDDYRPTHDKANDDDEDDPKIQCPQS